MSGLEFRAAFLALAMTIAVSAHLGSAHLRQNYYASSCPNVESIVRSVVTQKFKETFFTVPATIRLFFHDCFVQGCDASVIIASTAKNQAEKEHPDNLSLAGDGFDTVIKAKAAVEAKCPNTVSCADILAMATRDLIALTGGPSFPVELGRLDGLVSTSKNVEGNIPKPTFNLDKLNSMFSSHGLTQSDMIALSGAHTLGASHCDRFSNRLYNFSRSSAVDPTLNMAYAAELQAQCPKTVDPRVAIPLDPNTPFTFDNAYFTNLQQGMGIFSSDQALFTDLRSRPTVDALAASSRAFNQAFVAAITKLGRVGVKGAGKGNIRRDCAAFN